LNQEIKTKHNERIKEQFSKQAIPFTEIKGHYDSIDTIIDMSEVSKEHTVLDLACGTGIVSCEFAKHAKSVIGLDITQEMLDEAIKKQKIENLTNIEFKIGDVEKSPYRDESFDIIFTRYSFHHFLDTKKVFDEMVRVCKNGGKIIIVDVALKKQFAKAYNQMEKLRDPSHSKALTTDEFNTLFSNEKLGNHKQSFYSVDLELDNQLKASFPNDGDEQKIREIFQNDLEQNLLGLNTHLKDNKIHFSYPITIFVATKRL